MSSRAEFICPLLYFMAAKYKLCLVVSIEADSFAISLDLLKYFRQTHSSLHGDKWNLKVQYHT